MQLRSNYKIWQSAFILMLIVTICLVRGFPFLQEINWTSIENINYWKKTYEHSFPSLVAALLGITLLGISLATVAVTLLSLRLRKFQPDVRNNLKRLMRFFAFVPSLAWGLMVLVALHHISSGNIAVKVIFGSSIVFCMSLPMLFYLTLEEINNVPDKLIESGYALGASSSQIAFRIILPKKVNNIILNMLIVLLRICAETIVLMIIVQIIPFSISNMLSLGLFILFGGIIMFILSDNTDE